MKLFLEVETLKLLKCSDSRESIQPESPNLLFLLRHGESQKNRDNKHGIVKTKLTTKGKNELSGIIKMLSEINFRQQPTLYFSKLSTQVIETVNIITNHLNYDKVEDELLAPIFLGVVNGLTEEECLNQYPSISSNIKDWMQGKTDISNVIIPGAESATEFWNRGENFINQVKSQTAPAIVVGDRSILILLINHLMKNSIHTKGTYRFFTIPTGGLQTFLLMDDTVFLCGEYKTYNF